MAIKISFQAEKTKKNRKSLRLRSIKVLKSRLDYFQNTFKTATSSPEHVATLTLGVKENVIASERQHVPERRLLKQVNIKIMQEKHKLH